MEGAHIGPDKSLVFPARTLRVSTAPAGSIPSGQKPHTIHYKQHPSTKLEFIPSLRVAPAARDMRHNPTMAFEQVPSNALDFPRSSGDPDSPADLISINSTQPRVTFRSADGNADTHRCRVGSFLIGISSTALLSTAPCSIALFCPTFGWLNLTLQERRWRVVSRPSGLTSHEKGAGQVRHGCPY
jgi:hypothetical protein